MARRFAASGIGRVALHTAFTGERVLDVGCVRPGPPRGSGDVRDCFDCSACLRRGLVEGARERRLLIRSAGCAFGLDARLPTFDKYRVRICVIFNPAARGEKAKRFRRHLDDFGAECALKPTTAPGAARALAAEAVREAFDIVVAAGGDGTVNEVLNGIGDEPDGFSRTRLAVLPLGTINVFARELGLPLDVNRAWAAIRRGRVMAIDLPQVEFVAGGGPQRRFFAQLAGAGLDARAVELVNWNLKKKIGFFAYVVAALKALRGPQSSITAEGVLAPVTGEQVLVGNGRLYGGSFAVFPEARLTDGLLDVCIFPRVTWRTLIACGWGLVAGRLHKSGGTRHFQAESFSLTAPNRTPLELDGEIVGELPARFSVHHRMLRVVVP